ncbi:phosphopantetheine-binding protein, partial [Paenibacillus sp. Marseille-Q4541]|uniref:phosphopantetheine-binding protein n=1 Tax=Paenibacillus sp. Marseille-Q4541 TaxID=2831522 RepID=UPI001BABD718
PRDEIEECIAEVFQEILGTERIGIDDSFFELGGHSLRASRLVSLLEQRLGISLTLRDILADPNVRKLAEKAKIMDRKDRKEQNETLFLQLAAAVEEEV